MHDFDAKARGWDEGEKLRALGARNVDVVRRDLEREPIPGTHYDVVCKASTT